MAANNNKKRSDLFWGILFVVYLLLLFYFLFFSEKMGRSAGGEQYRYNLILFREIRRFCKYRNIVGNQVFFINIFGNIMAFVPFGLLMPRLFKRTNNVILITVMTLELSLAVEVVQLIFKLGSFDVDDLLLNTVGGLIGYLIYALVGRRRKRDVSEQTETV
jgi:glycopeptide antibiotics resistance protein